MTIYRSPILRDGDAGGSGGGGGGATAPAFDVNTMAPVDLRSESSLVNIKTIPDLVKGYVSAQKMIGAKRVAIPGDNAGEAEWDAFYAQVGRPDTHDKYGIPEIQMDESIRPDQAKLDEVRKTFHKLGLTTKQAHGVMSMYMNSMNKSLSDSRAASAGASATAINGLKTEWGDKFASNIDVAKATIRKFGDENLLQYLESNEMGNNVHLIKLLHKVGMAVLEDRDRGGAGGGSIDLNEQTRAVQEIEKLRTDKEFQEALTTANHPGHRSAVDRWMQLHTIAHPGKSE